MGADDIRFDLLPWDSEQFGFSVARVHSSVAPVDLAHVVYQMRELGVVLAYYGLADSCPPLADRDAASVGARLADTRVVFRKDLDSRPARKSAGDETTAQQPTENSDATLLIRSVPEQEAGTALIELARDAGRFSRFRTDPRINPKVFRAIYDAWLIRSLRREIADDVFVGSFGGEDVGLVTVSAPQGDASIGLLSISESARGRGFGRAMTEHAFGWAADRRSRALRVVTQLANAPAYALYASLGCAIESQERTYHIWLA